MDIEQQLRAGLAARDPGPDFTDAVLARLAQRAAAPSRRPRNWRVPAALAAGVLVAAFGLHAYLVQQRAARAHEQLLLALQITSYELNSVQQKLVRIEPQENGT